MTNYITGQEFTDLTGITSEEVGEQGSDATIRNAMITRAQEQFEIDVGRSFDGTESDYNLAKQATAFLTAHLIRLRKLEVMPSTAEADSRVSSPYYQEYRRLVGLIRNAKRDDDTRPVFTAGFDNIATEDLPE